MRARIHFDTAKGANSMAASKALVSAKNSENWKKTLNVLPAKVELNYLTDAGDPLPTENFRTDIKLDRYRKRNDRAKRTTVLGLFGLAASSFTSVALLQAALDKGLGIPLGVWITDWSALGISGALLGLGWHLNSIPVTLKLHLTRQFEAWLRQRYHLNSKDIYTHTMVSLLLERRTSGGWAFESTEGGYFRLKFSNEGSWVEEIPQEKVTPNDYLPAGTPAALSPAHIDEPTLVEQLPLEAKVLYERRQELLKLIEGRTHSPEGEHVVKRVQEDSRQLLNLNAQLCKLGKLSQLDSDALTEALRDLNGELEDVLDQERSGLSQLLHAHRGYIRARKANPALQLQLPAVPDTLDDTTISSAQEAAR